MSVDLISRWFLLRQKIEDNKKLMEETVVQEMLLRRQVMSTIWPKPEEGVNKYDLGDGYILKGTHKIDRKVDKPALPAIQEQLQKMLVNTDDLTRNTPELELRAYRQLTEEQRKIMDQALIIKPKAPEIELVPPKAKV